MLLTLWFFLSNSMILKIKILTQQSHLKVFYVKKEDHSLYFQPLNIPFNSDSSDGLKRRKKMMFTFVIF